MQFAFQPLEEVAISQSGMLSSVNLHIFAFKNHKRTYEPTQGTNTLKYRSLFPNLWRLDVGFAFSAGSKYPRIVANAEANAVFIHIRNIFLLHINTSADGINILVKHVDLLRLRAADSGGLDRFAKQCCDSWVALEKALNPSFAEWFIITSDLQHENNFADSFVRGSTAASLLLYYPAT